MLWVLLCLVMMASRHHFHIVPVRQLRLWLRGQLRLPMLMPQLQVSVTSHRLCGRRAGDATSENGASSFVGLDWVVFRDT